MKTHAGEQTNSRSKLRSKFRSRPDGLNSIQSLIEASELKSRGVKEPSQMKGNARRLASTQGTCARTQSGAEMERKARMKNPNRIKASVVDLLQQPLSSETHRLNFKAPSMLCVRVCTCVRMCLLVTAGCC